MVAKGRYLRTIDSEINIKRLHNYYNKICPDFYQNLTNGLKKKLVFRSSTNNYWGEKTKLKKKCKFSKVDFNRNKIYRTHQGHLTKEGKNYFSKLLEDKIFF